MSAGAGVAAVTGAARGIGLAIAVALVEQGYRVALGDIDEALAREQAGRLGRGSIGVRLDVRSDESVAAFIEVAENELGPLDLLVNNAGIMWVGAFSDEPEHAALRQMDVNFHGSARAMRHVLPRMRSRGSGHVINIASAASKLAPPGEATYAATKHAVYGYSLAVREELRGSGVQISVVMPVVVETDLAVGTSHGRGRRLQPADVARAVVATVREPRFEVFVPRSLGPVARLVAVLPQGARDRIYRALVPDQVRSADSAARSGYQARLGGDPPR
ncbi:MAG: SDR family oxidoreductase [Thermoleophilaceae bacterium]